MPIDPLHLKSVGGLATPATGRTSAGAQAAPAAQTSSQAAAAAAPEVLVGRSISGDGQTFDVARIAQIRAAIADGSFRVDAEAVAEGLIATVRDLIRNNPRQA